MKPNRKRDLCTALSLLLLLGACSSAADLTYGEKIQNQGAETQQIGQNWSEGESLVTKGNSLIQSGNKHIDKGKDMISEGESTVREGETLVRQGNRLKSGAEESYQRRNLGNLPPL